MHQTRNERMAWQSFEKWMREAQQIIGHQVPVCLITLPVSHDGVEAGDLGVKLSGTPKLIWPNGFPEEHKKTILERIAAAYANAAKMTIEVPQEEKKD